MHIGIDGRFLQGPNTGVTTYLLNLLRGISRVDKTNTYTVFLSDLAYENRIPPVNNFRTEVNTANSLIWKNVWLLREKKRLKIDIMHFPAYTLPFLNINNSIVTIHDLIHKVNPRWFSKKELFLLELPIQMAARKAVKIIAVSENTKRDIVKYCKVSADKVSVTPEAADSSFKPISDTTLLGALKKKYNIDFDFILCVGVLFKRRNIARLLEAYASLIKNKALNCKLVIAGPPKEYFDLNAYIKRYGVDKDVAYLGYVQQEDMPLLYNAASFFVYPSLYEGFGLPVLEAMSCGKAVITSDVSSLPEILGDTGILIDPYKTEELYGAMCRFAADKTLREECGRRALERSRLFNWDKMAQQTIKIYEEAIKNNA